MTKKLTIEGKIANVFEELTKTEDNVSFVFSYSYTRSNGQEKKNGEEVEGRISAYGAREIVDIHMESLEEAIEENTDKDDFVNI